MLAQQLLNGLISGSVDALFALSFTMIFGIHNILNLAQGAIFMWGAFIGLYCIVLLELPFALALVVAALAAGCLSVLLDFIAFRPLRRRGAPEFSGLLASIGASLILMDVAERVSSARVLRYPFGAFPVRIFHLLGLRVTLLQLSMAILVAVILTALLVYIYWTRFGQRIRAVAVSERTAGILGVNPNWVYFQTFFISGALAGVAGVLIGIAFNSVHFLMGEPYMLHAFVIIVLGGLGSVAGAVVAGLALGVVRTLCVAYVSSGLSDAIIYSLLFACLLVRPTGLFGTLRMTRRVVRA